MTRHGPQHRTEHRDKPDKTGEARERILDAAEKLFAAQGYDATPTSHIAKEADVPKGLLFYYFPAKFALLSALLAERATPLDFRAEELASPGDPVRSLVNVAAGYAATQATSEVIRVIIWREEHTHPQAAAALINHRAALEDVIRQVLAATLESEVPPPQLQAAAHLWASVLTATSSAATFEDGEDCLLNAAELLCVGLRAQASSASV